MITNLINFIKDLLLNKSFWIGMIFCFCFFSKYILGPDNFAEEFGEKKVKEVLGIDTDFSPETIDPDIIR